MTVKTLLEKTSFEVLNTGEENREITVPFCCDLLSVAMGRAPAGCAWVTVMGNRNVIAVAALTETAVVILAEDAALDAAAQEAARQEGVTVLRTKEPVYAAARAVDRLLGGA